MLTHCAQFSVEVQGGHCFDSTQIKAGPRTNLLDGLCIGIDCSDCLLHIWTLLEVLCPWVRAGATADAVEEV